MESTTSGKGRESTQVKTMRKLKTQRQQEGGGEGGATAATAAASAEKKQSVRSGQEDLRKVEFEEDEEEQGGAQEGQKREFLAGTSPEREREARAQLLDQDDEEQLSPRIRNKDQSGYGLNSAASGLDDGKDGSTTGMNLSPDKKLKRKINVKEKQKFYGMKEDPYAYESQAGEYFNINMEQAMAYVFNKSKEIKEKIENDFISNDFLKEHLIESKHFNVSYNSYLQRLCNKKLLHPEFKNVPKKTLQKLEKFFIERIDKCMESQKIHQAYVEKANYIQECFDKRIAELRDKIKQKNKLGSLPE